MRIEKDFPYKKCESCLGCALKVTETTEWLNGHGVIVLTVRCKYAEFCDKNKNGKEVEKE